MRIDLEVVLPVDATGKVELVWAYEEDEPLVFQITKLESQLLCTEYLSPLTIHAHGDQARRHD